MTATRIVDTLLGRPDPAEVVCAYGSQVHRHLKRIFGPGADVDDAYQMVFMEVLRSLPSFRGLSKLSTWIRRITWNVAYQEMRMRYRHQRVTPLDPLSPVLKDDQEPADEVLDRQQAMRRIYSALQEIDPKQRTAVVMHDIEGKTLKEVSRALGRPLPTVASQLYAGRARLAESIGDHLQHVSDRRPGHGRGQRKERPS